MCIRDRYKDNSSVDWVKVNSSEKTMQMVEKKVQKSIVPDVTGMGARDAVFLLENAGLKVRIQGAGKVLRQSIQPGSRTNGQQVSIYLN